MNQDLAIAAEQGLPRVADAGWPEILGTAAELVFETDAAGLLRFVAPERALGHEAGDLLGREAHGLLVDPSDGDPFAAGASSCGRRVWMRRADGSSACLLVTAAPLHDALGREAGVRGFAQEVTRKVAPFSVALHRAAVAEQVLDGLRGPASMVCPLELALDLVCDRMGAAGATLLDPIGFVLRLSGTVLALPPGSMPARAGAAGRRLLSVGGHGVLVCGGSQPGDPVLALWRGVGAAAWAEADVGAAEAAIGLLRLLLGQEQVAGALSGQARSDGLTGLFKREAFGQEMGRRIDRLDRESVPGTLLLLDLDHFRRMNACWGQELGDGALLATAEMLRRTFRPADLIGRLGGDLFAAWLDNADELSVAERAEKLRLEAPGTFAALAVEGSLLLGVSMGIACRQVASAETVDSLTRRAQRALRHAKAAGRGRWYVSHDPAES